MWFSSFVFRQLMKIRNLNKDLQPKLKFIMNCPKSNIPDHGSKPLLNNAIVGTVRWYWETKYCQDELPGDDVLCSGYCVTVRDGVRWCEWRGFGSGYCEMVLGDEVLWSRGAGRWGPGCTHEDLRVESSSYRLWGGGGFLFLCFQCGDRLASVVWKTDHVVIHGLEDFA